MKCNVSYRLKRFVSNDFLVLKQLTLFKDRKYNLTIFFFFLWEGYYCFALKKKKLIFK